MINVYPYLEAIKEKIKELNEFKSVKIGLERGADKAINCPFVRIIQEAQEYEGFRVDLILQIVVVFDVKNDLEKLYKEFNEAIYKIELKLLELPVKIEPLSVNYDEDRLMNLKAGVLRIKLKDLDEN